MSAETTTVVVAMPHMGVSVDEGTVVEWRKAVGEEVSAGETLCEISTDKVDTEVPAPAGGVLTRILAEVGASVPVGEPLCELDGGEGTAVAEAGGESPPGTTGTAAPSAPQSLVADSATKLDLKARTAAGRDEFGRFDPRAAAAAVLSFLPSGGSRGGAGAGASVTASPVARRMADAHGVDLATVEGSGRGGRIRKRDVEEAISRSAAPDRAADPPRGYEDVPHEVVETSRMRRAIAEHMVRSRRTAAHMTTEVDVDLSAVVRARGALNQARLEAGEPKLSYLPFIARAACVAIGEHPEVNATFLGERVVHWSAVNLGVAVDTPEGLLVPVVRDCEKLTAPAIGAAIADLATRARERRLVPDELAGGTFTISNPGSVGAVSAPAIINQPQVAILGVPAIQRRPWVLTDEHGDEAVAIRSILRLAVTFDHRALDGADATRFAVAVGNHLETWSTEAYT